MTHYEAAHIRDANDHRSGRAGERFRIVGRLAPASAVVLGTLVMMRAGAVAQELPVPPVPPDSPPLAEIAPTPNVDVRAPAATVSEAPTVNVKLYRASPFDPSMGFAPGSRYQSTEDRKAIQTPGVSISVPLK